MEQNEKQNENQEIRQGEKQDINKQPATKSRKKKILKILLALGIVAIIISVLYYFVGKDLRDLNKMVKANSETKEFAKGYFFNAFKKPEIDLTDEVTKGEIPHFLQWDKRWGYRNYGGSMIAVSGCGPTCLSMVVCGLTGETEWNPLEVARFSRKNKYYLPGTGTTWALMQEGAEKLGLKFKEVPAVEGTVKKRLEEGKPIICSVKKGDFTSTGHFIVLAALNSDGTVKVNDPNSKIRSEKSWEISQILPQVRAMWCYWVE